MGFHVMAQSRNRAGRAIVRVIGLAGIVALAGCAAKAPNAALQSSGMSLAEAPPPAISVAPASVVAVEVAPPATTQPAAPAKKTALSSLGDLSLEREKAVQKIGKPYKIAGLWYVPKHQPDYDESGIASWYGPKFHGKSTANGEIYNQTRLTAAHPTLPLPSYVEVTNLANGRTLVVRVNDRGPYKRGRILDLSARAAQLLGYQGNGTAQVRVRYVGKAPLAGDDRYEQEYLSKQAWHSGGAVAKTTEVALTDFTASIDEGDPAPAIAVPVVPAEAAPAATPVLKAPVIASAAVPAKAKSQRRVASSK